MKWTPYTMWQSWRPIAKHTAAKSMLSDWFTWLSRSQHHGKSLYNAIYFTTRTATTVHRPLLITVTFRCTRDSLYRILEPPGQWCAPPHWRHTSHSTAPKSESWAEHFCCPILRHPEERERERGVCAIIIFIRLFYRVVNYATLQSLPTAWGSGYLGYRLCVIIVVYNIQYWFLT